MKWFERKKELPDGVKDSLMPDRHFAEKAKKEFLISFDLKQSSRKAGAVFLPNEGRSRMMGWKIAATAFAALGVVAATSVFADVQNVGPTNPLYPLKRLAESAQLAFSSSDAKPALELSFAEKRAAEINDLASQPNSANNAPLVAGLTQQLDDEVSSSLAAETGRSKHGDWLSAFCTSVASMGQSAGATTSDGFAAVSVVQQLGVHPELGARALTLCGIAPGADMASSQASSSASETSSLSMPVHRATPSRPHVPSLVSASTSLLGGSSTPAVDFDVSGSGADTGATITVPAVHVTTTIAPAPSVSTTVTTPVGNVSVSIGAGSSPSSGSGPSSSSDGTNSGGGDTGGGSGVNVNVGGSSGIGVGVSLPSLSL